MLPFFYSTTSTGACPSAIGMTQIATLANMIRATTIISKTFNRGAPRFAMNNDPASNPTPASIIIDRTVSPIA